MTLVLARSEGNQIHVAAESQPGNCQKIITAPECEQIVFGLSGGIDHWRLALRHYNAKTTAIAAARELAATLSAFGNEGDPYGEGNPDPKIRFGNCAHALVFGFEGTDPVCYHVAKHENEGFDPTPQRRNELSTGVWIGCEIRQLGLAPLGTDAAAIHETVERAIQRNAMCQLFQLMRPVYSGTLSPAGWQWNVPPPA